MIRPLAVLICALAISGCAASGVKVDPAKAESFQPGISTCADVRAVLGAPTQTQTTQSTYTHQEVVVWIYSFAGAQAHPENFIPVVNLFASGADAETSTVAFVFYRANCVLAKTGYATSGMGSGSNLESITLKRNGPREVE